MKYYALDKKSLLFPKKARKSKKKLMSNSNSRSKRSKEKCRKCPVKAILLILIVLLRKDLCQQKKNHKSNLLREFKILLKMCMSSWKKTRRRIFLENVKLNYKEWNSTLSKPSIQYFSLVLIWHRKLNN